jgi:hypothetical protein
MSSGVGLTTAGAVRTPSGDVEELSWRMEQLPRQMRTFSRNMRSLFAENALTGEHASSRKFRRYFSTCEDKEEECVSSILKGLSHEIFCTFLIRERGKI